jgi:hypothetical protein
VREREKTKEQQGTGKNMGDSINAWSCRWNHSAAWHRHRPPPQHRQKRSKSPPPPRQVTLLPPHSCIYFFSSLHVERIAFCMQGWGGK